MRRQTPRGPDGRFACVPSYPRLRTSACGCAAGGVHPCPVGRKLKPVRDAAKAKHRAARRYVPTDDDRREVERLEEELYGVQAEREALQGAIYEVRSEIDAHGYREHRARDQGVHGNTSRGRGYSATDRHGEDSERGYEDLLDQRRQLRAHEKHLQVEARQLRDAIRRVRAGQRHSALSGAARRKRAAVIGAAQSARTASRAARRAGRR